MIQRNETLETLEVENSATVQCCVQPMDVLLSPDTNSAANLNIHTANSCTRIVSKSANLWFYVCDSLWYLKADVVVFPWNVVLKCTIVPQPSMLLATLGCVTLNVYPQHTLPHSMFPRSFLLVNCCYSVQMRGKKTDGYSSVCTQQALGLLCVGLFSSICLVYPPISTHCFGADGAQWQMFAGSWFGGWHPIWGGSP